MDPLAAVIDLVAPRVGLFTPALTEEIEMQMRTNPDRSGKASTMRLN
jgi:hypothetical protein